MIYGTIIDDPTVQPTVQAETIFEQPEQNIEQNINNENTESADDLTDTFKKMFDAFTDKIPEGTHQEKSSKNIFKKFSDYIGSKDFKDQLNEKADKYKVPPKQIAKNFFFKVLGIIGDILGIVVNTVCSIVDTAVTIFSTLLHGAVAIINKVSNAIVSVITLNQTTIKTQTIAA